jgi:hypothetical protein
MAKPLTISLALSIAALATASWAGPQWDRISMRAGGGNIPNGLQDSRGSMSQAQPAAQYSGAEQDNARRQANRMSPEERANLRRQINEAGHDIYIPRR